MVKLRSYTHMRGVHLEYTTWEWDATYHTILYRADVGMHSDTPITSPIDLGTLSGTDASSEKLATQLFLYPLVPEEHYVLDGVAQGNVVIASNAVNYNGYWWSAHLDRILITLESVGRDGVCETIATYSLGEVVEGTGGAGRIVNRKIADYEEDAQWQYAFPFWLEISAAEVPSWMRLRLRVEAWARHYTSDSTAGNTLYLVAGPNSDDLYVRVPIV